MKTNLQALRLKAGFKSAKLFADHIGMSVNTYTGYEQGKRNFSLEHAWLFADALHVSIDELAGREWPRRATNPLTRDEERTLEKYRQLTPSRQEAVNDMLDGLVAKSKASGSGSGSAERIAV